ncbi:MAG: ThiF family adenylyltransferase [Desulfobacteraceae bacterium]|jgi:molybdopterin/thiamine biosynthesis adenylyltransferase/nitroreductase
MENQKLLSILRDYGLETKEDYEAQAFSRNIGIFSIEEQQRLHKATVGIPGMGGVGGAHLMTLVRSGIGNFKLADFDTFDPVNINRQFGAKVPTFGRSKLDVMIDEALSVNPFLHIAPFPEGLTEGNLDAFLDGVEIVVDGLDFFVFDTRRALFNRARERGIPVITAGPLGFGAAVLVFDPKQGLSFDDYFDVNDEMPEEEKYLRFAMGLAPKALQFKYIDTKKVSLKAKAGPSTIIACNLCSSIAAMEAVRVLLNKKGLKPVPCYLQMDPYLAKLKQGRLRGGNKHPIQKLKRWVVRAFLLKRSNAEVNPHFPSPPEKVSIKDVPPNELVRFLVEAGSWAPSADNCQPWEFNWNGEQLELRSNPKRTGFFYDVRNESTLMTFGAVLENMDIAASHYGLGLQTQYHVSNEPNSQQQVDISFVKREGTESELFSSLPLRRINRRPYDKRPIEKNLVTRLFSAVHETEGAQLLWIDDKERQKTLQRIIFSADRILFEEKRLHQGLFRWVRMKGMEDTLSENEGMGTSELELGLMGGLIFPVVANWRMLSFLNKIGMSRALGLNSIKLLRRTPAYALITMGERSPESYIEGGRALERFWISACGAGLAVQPMAGFIFLLNHYHHDGASQFRPAHKKMIQEMESRYLGLLQDEKARVPIMFFRVGYASPQKVSSRRIAPQDILARENESLRQSP